MSPGARGVVRWVFGVYAAALFVGTHWPALVVQGPVERSDLWTHAAAFCVWTLLVIACGWFGPRWSMRNVVACAALGVAYAALDEATQAIPVLKRNAAWDDLGADVLGVCIGTAGALAWRWVRRAPGGAGA